MSKIQGFGENILSNLALQESLNAPILQPGGTAQDQLTLLYDLSINDIKLINNAQPIFQKSLAFENLPINPSWIALEIPSDISLGSLEVDSSGLVQRYSLLKLTYADGKNNSETKTPRVLTLFDASGNTYLNNIVDSPVNALDINYEVRLFSVDKSISIVDVLSKVNTNDDDVLEYEINPYSSETRWEIDRSAGVVVFYGNYVPDLSTKNLFISFTKFVGALDVQPTFLEKDDLSNNRLLYINSLNQIDTSELKYDDTTKNFSIGDIEPRDAYKLEVDGNVNVLGKIYQFGKEISSGSSSGNIPQGNELPANDNSNEGDLFITTGDNKLYRFNGTSWVALSGEGGGGGLFKSESDASASELIVSQTEKQPTSGDLYFNTKESVFNYYADETSAADKWVPIALSRLSGQPPPLIDISINITTAFMDITWRNPTQIDSYITSEISYLNKNSPASQTNGFGQNLILFPVVNRIVMKATEINDDGTDGSVLAFPMFKETGTPITSIFDKDAYAIFEKGNILPNKDTAETSHTTYTSVAQNNLLKNMPTGIRIFKSAPTRTNRNSILDGFTDKLIIPFSTDTGRNLSAPAKKYRFDFWLENNSSSQQIMPVTIEGAYEIADAPIEPRSVELSLKQNSDDQISKALTQSAISVIDPLNVAGIDDTQNDIVTFEGIHFEWSIDNFVDTCFNFVKLRGINDGNDSFSKIFSGNEVTLTDGVMSINRNVDTSTTKRFYTFDITSNFLGSAYSQIDFTKKVNISVRVSYKNSSNPAFGSTLSSSILFGKPIKPTINFLKMSRSDKVNVQLAPFTTDDVISIDPSNNLPISNSPNNNYAIFVKTLDFVFERELDDGNVDEFNMTNDITNFGNNNSNSSRSSVQNSNTEYVFTIPGGLSTSGTTANSSYKIRVKIRVKNNLVSEYSEFSDVAGTPDTIDDTSNNALKITKVIDVENNRINTLSYRSLGSSSQDQLTSSWGQPNNFERGVINGKTTDGTNPKIYDYAIRSFRGDIPESNRRTTENINTQSNRTTDATNDEIIDIRDIVMYNGDTTITTKGQGSTDGEKAINVLIQQRNEYTSTDTSFNRNFYYDLSSPPPPTENTFLSDIKNESDYFNDLIIRWNKPSTQGLKTGTTSGSLNDTDIAINRYRIKIIADKTTTGSPYFKQTELPDDPSMSNIGVFNIAANSSGTIDDTVDAQTYVIGDDGKINYVNKYYDTNFGSREVVVSSSEAKKVIVYPDTSYIVQIYSTNRYHIESEMPLEISHQTGSPPTNVDLLETASIPQTDLINLDSENYNYENKGFILDRDNPDNTSVDTSPFTLTNVNNLPPTQTSTSVKHRVNTKHFMNFLPVKDYVTDPSNLKLRQFRIVDVAKDPDNNVLVYGNDTTIYPSTEPISIGDVSGIFKISTTERKDTFSSSIEKNTGYWWKENVQYSFDYNNKTDDLYGKAIKLEFRVRYNNKLTSNSSFASSSLDTNTNVDIKSKEILINSENPNEYTYFDKLNKLPEITKYNTKPYITRDDVSKFSAINGIPNLYPFTIDGEQHIYIYYFNYTLNNYSEYFALDTTKSFTRHKLTKLNIDYIDSQTWGTGGKENSTRNLNGWDISNSELVHVNVGDKGDTSYKDIQVQVIAMNTFGRNTITLNETNELNTFIYDKKSADLISDTLFGLSSAFNAPTSDSEFSSKGQLMEVPSDFSPEIADSSTQITDFTETPFNSYGNTFNDKQLLLYDGYFRTPLNFKNNVFDITNTTVKTNYGVTDNITLDSGYSYSIFKFTRIRNNTSEGAGSIDIFRFLLSFGENNNITWDDLENENVILYIQSGRTTDTTNGTPTSINAYSYVGGSNSIKWMRYKPSTNIGDTAVKKGNSTDISVTFSDGLGNTNISSLNKNVFNTGSSRITTQPYDSSTKNISGLFFGGNSLSTTNDGYTFYVSVGIKRNTDIYFDGIQSFDIIDSNGTLRRDLLTK